MATQKYELKRGYVAQFDNAFNGIKSFTNDTVTDELAAEYLRRYPSRAIYFSRLPVMEAYVPPEVKIIPPKVEAKVDETVKVDIPKKEVVKRSRKAKK
jgi:hypothetical protein